MTGTQQDSAGAVGLVVVSHSRALAEAAVALTLQMVDEPPPVAIAAGTDDGGFGTDGVAVSGAIADVAAKAPGGVLVLMDLGSAVLSAEMALELTDTDDVPVVLSPAPLVEGLVGAVVAAAAGATLHTVATEAAAGTVPKETQLADTPLPPSATAGEASDEATSSSTRVTLHNPSGLHLRPAAALVAEAGAHDATVTISVPESGRSANAASVLSLVALKVETGTEILISATGPDRAAAVAAIAGLARSGFGEVDPDALSD
ncbi:dihydroxyacetone kinase phosphoryl donor subunit DhaM [Euzebya tangerina]|uniref:dihydroxyacetone kinase phosphoryl donor subunit DhaM n=1 Tax=Euzebya tangerina TaxID=591198 RepID=UPI00196ADF5C|nr:dihydroxyacetone kinase phosphoryl donor subunit DhaM [Euzebya tangerina]